MYTSFGVLGIHFEVLCGTRALLFQALHCVVVSPQEAKPDSKVVNQDEMVVASLNKQMDNPSSSLTNTSPEMYPKSFIYSPPAQKQQPPSSFNNNKPAQMHPFSTNISPESSSLSLNNSSAQKHKRSFVYSSSSSESKSSKLQEEFFTPQPLMTMKRLEHFSIPKEGLLAQVAKVHYEEKKLENIIDPHLWKQMDPESFHVFSKTAYYCLKERRAERPNIDQIVKRLEKALELQLTRENSVRACI
ncbi:hypothetical protein Tco_0706386 [Tanacetum coccineum]|uniref:Uncharacterized protein n=1 Tax=Tanacetum coccineum TaxID=301880 RepID=A0ABQ4Y7D7_9ASTR